MSALDIFDEFVESMWISGEKPVSEEVAIAALGLTGEAGEAAEKIKKWLRGDVAAGKIRFEDHKDLLKKELGDVLFYITKLAHLHGWDLEQIAQGNIDKLTDRRARTGTMRGNGDNR